MDGAQAHGTTDIRRVLADLFERAVLAGAAPFLLFPSLRPKAALAALGALLAVWAITTVLREEAWPLTPFNGALLLFIPMVGVGILVSALPELTLPKAMGLILGLAAFRAVAAARERPFPRVAVAEFILVGLVILLAGALGTGWAEKIPAWKTLLSRLPARFLRLPETQGAGIHPNELAGALVLYLPLPLSALFGWRPAWRRIPGLFAALGGFLGCGAALLLTQSRSGWLGGAAGLLALGTLWLLRSRKCWVRFLGIALPLLALGILAVAVWQAGPMRFREAFDAATNEHLETPLGAISLEGRIELWSRALYAIQDFPFTGCGLGTFRRVVHMLYPLFLTPPDTDVAHAHNVFLQVALDLGIPGLVAYLALLGAAGAAAWSAGRPGAPMRWVPLGLLAGLVGYHAYGITDAIALGAKPGLAFWLALGVMGNFAATLEASEKRR